MQYLGRLFQSRVWSHIYFQCYRNRNHGRVQYR